MSDADKSNQFQFEYNKPARQPKKKLLYIEDNVANLVLFERIISRRSDLTLLTATNGRAGIELAKQYLPDAILMDIVMPGINGFETLHILRTHPLTSHIPAIALSSSAYQRDIERGMQVGFSHYLTKPYNIEALMVAIDAAVQYSAISVSLRRLNIVPKLPMRIWSS